MSNKTFKVLFVCTGNTCRSPMAEGILKSILHLRGIDNIDVSSAGIAGLVDHPATGNAIEAAKLWDVDISGHRSRSVDSDIIESSDLILVMSSNHVDYILNLVPEAREKTFLLKGFPKPYSPTQENVHDPIGGPLELYNQTFMELDEAIRRFEKDIIEMSGRAGD